MTGDHLTNDVLRYPGLNLPTRAILMALGSSVLPSVINIYLRGFAYCWYCLLRVWVLRTTQRLLSTTLRQPAPSPILRLL
nr:hypothetical protein OG409_08350 [Streptomyces sp. NBC_00974]